MREENWREKTKAEEAMCCEMPGDSNADVSLFIIAQRGRRMYWTCSTEHGCGWNSVAKQSFSKSELVREIGRMIDDGHFQNIEVLKLRA